jgi:D-lyxose ketol-isomerase
MLKRSQVCAAQDRAARMLDEANIRITREERATIEIAEFGLGELERTGLEIVTYVNTDSYCAKELILFPGQTCPEHRHPPIQERPGKKETFRCRWGEVYLYTEGPAERPIRAAVPKGSEPYYTVREEHVLLPGAQYTIPSDVLHWFQAGDEGAIVSEFSSPSRDDSDVFTDPRIRRIPEVIED